MRFEQPWALLILLLAPYFLFLARWSRSGLERGRAVTGTVLRVAILVALVFALAEAQWVSHSARTVTIFAVDRSLSIPADLQARSMEWVQAQLGKLPKDDLAGVIVFGGESMIELPPSEKPELLGTHSLVTRTATDLAAAVRLATAVIPEGYRRRIVLITDGNENRGDVMAEVEIARAHGTVIDVFPLRYDYPGEVWIESVHVTPEVHPKEPFDVTVVVNAQGAGRGRLTLFRDGTIVEHRPVELAAGKNVFAVAQKIEAAGSTSYRALIEAAGDAVSQNNQGQAATAVRGEARVAILPGEPADGDALAAALKAEGFEVVTVSPENAGRGLEDPSAFDAIVFANVEAAQVPRGLQERISAAVHDTGVGFLMIGGERSFGPGGYRGSAVEEMLPVTMEQPQRRVLPNGALCLILHTCEIPEGNYWAKEIGLAALNTLNAQDYMGVLHYGFTSGEGWLFEMQLVKDRQKLADLIRGASPGDMPSFDRPLTMAIAGLTPLNAASKHIVVISDADPAGPSRNLLDTCVQNRITISTIAIFPHGNSDIDKMVAVAQYAGGRFYNVTDPKTLPQIFIKEASTLQRSMIIEGTIPPAVTGSAEALKGIDPAEVPNLHGYVLTNPKPLARVSLGAPVAREGGGAEPAAVDALLSEWTYGLGRTMAFASDAKARWGRDWVAWPKYGKFWSQALRSILRTVARAPYAAHTEIEGGRGKIVIEAVDEQGRTETDLRFEGTVTAPGGKKGALAFRQSGPGRYEADFEASETGTYGITATFESPHGGKGYLSQLAPLPYAPEYRDLRTNTPLIEKIRERTGGRRLGPESPVYEAMARMAGIPRAMWPGLLLFVLIAFPLDVFVRRVAVEWGPLARRAWAAVRTRRRAPRAVAVPESLEALAKAKREVAAARPAPVRGPVDLGPAGSATPAPEAKAPGVPAAPPPVAPATPAPRHEDDYLKRLMEAKKKAKDR